MSSGARGGTQVTSGRGDAPSQVATLRAVNGPAKGAAWALNKVHGTVGRHPTNDLVLDDPEVSGVHLELRRVGGRLHLEDAGSTNGTWLGPHRIHQVELAPGGEVRVGATVLRYDEGTPPPGGNVEGELLSSGSPATFGGLVGRSPVMLELFTTLTRIAPKALSVLVQGETGTGKEEVARAIHAHSARTAGPFVVIDATSLPETLVESLLFGHEKGAFTGADQRRVGLFEAADGGTLFLDELGELPLPAQAKFLRVLERQEFTRVGGHSVVKVDVRVVAATNRDLRHEVEQGRFREDLFFRLAQVHVHLPPLRARREDLEVIIERLLTGVAPDRTVALDPEAMAYLRGQPWPGNVRELRNVLLRAVALAPAGAPIRRADVAGEGLGLQGGRTGRGAVDLSGSFAEAKERALEHFEMAYLGAVMRRSNGNLSLAARNAGLARHYFRDLLRKRGLYGTDWGDGGADDEG